MKAEKEIIRNNPSSLQQDEEELDLPPPGFELGNSNQGREPYFSSTPSCNVLSRSIKEGVNDVLISQSLNCQDTAIHVSDATAENLLPSCNYIGQFRPPSLNDPPSNWQIKAMKREEDDDGPPPGWEIKTVEMKLEDEDSDADVNAGWQSLTPSPSSSPSQQHHTPFSSFEPPMLHPSSSLPQISSEMGQMVCGSCRGLLSYPKGCRNVQCGSCQVTNYVLEADEIGIVKCDYCAVLLMYPYSASSIQCTTCSSITHISEHNKRPPWSVQQRAS